MTTTYEAWDDHVAGLVTQDSLEIFEDSMDGSVLVANGGLDTGSSPQGRTVRSKFRINPRFYASGGQRPAWCSVMAGLESHGVAAWHQTWL